MGLIAKALRALYMTTDTVYPGLDKRWMRRTRNLRLVPGFSGRRGGKKSYGEWCYVVGVFQTLLAIHLEKSTGNHILDVGCGTGLLGIAAEPFIAEGGKYVGIEVMDGDVRFCRQHFPVNNFSFQHLDVANATYAPGQEAEHRRWEIDDGTMDMVTALSVWTHLNEDDALFYFGEIARVLAPGGKAMVTFFVLDDQYDASVPGRTGAPGRFHNTRQTAWVFDHACEGSGDWRYPAWAKHPEDAIGVTPAGLKRMTDGAGLDVVRFYAGNWREAPGVYFQDVLVLEKPT